MNNKNEFSTNYIIGYQNLDSNLLIKPSGLISYLQETSVKHSQWAGFPMTWFFNEMKGWILINWDIEILSYPSWNEKIKVETWPVLFNGILAQRAFRIKDEKDNTILNAMSKWVYTDLKKRRPVHPPKEMPEKYGLIKPSLFETDFKIPFNDNLKKVSTHYLKVTRQDIDTNLHVNNISYFKWFLDYIDEKTYNNMKIKNLKILYKKECIKDTDIKIDIYNYKNTFYCSISDCNNNLLTEIYTLWK